MAVNEQMVGTALSCAVPMEKVALTIELYQSALRHGYHRDSNRPLSPVIGRPEKPKLVPPKDLVARKVTDSMGHAALLHALAHIEFNAINLALDAVIAFPDMPNAFALDWLLVASDEARHFKALAEYLIVLGYPYGEFPAHNGLMALAEKTRYDVLARMALVPRLMEARGLDVGPGLLKKLKQIDDSQGVAILEMILHEEEQHVLIGNHWYRHICEHRSLCPMETFINLVKQHAEGVIRPPINKPPRIRAGFTEDEVEWLTQQCQ